MASTSLPHLPAELWAQVLQNVDDPFSLWVTCRQVSRTWRTEGEHAFRTVFLPILHIEWTRVAFGRIAHTIIAIPDEHSIKSQSTTLSLVLRWGEPRSEVMAPNHPEDFTRDKFRRELAWITKYNDYHSWLYNSPLEMNEQAIWFDTADGRYTFVGSAETIAFTPQYPAQEQDMRDRRRVTCDWKVLMDALFAEEVFVRRRHPGPSFYELGEQGMHDIVAGEDHPMEPRTVLAEKFKPLYAAAFQERLRRAFNREGVDLYTHDSFTSVCNANQQLDYHIEKTGCGWMMNCRFERLQAFLHGLLKRERKRWDLDITG
jgi:uncharacterized protein YbdZ (MbtH family)